MNFPIRMELSMGKLFFFYFRQTGRMMEDPAVMDATNTILTAMKEKNFDFQDCTMDEFNRFFLPMGYVIDMGRLMSHFNLTDDELAQFKPFYSYIKTSQDIFNSLINDMEVFSWEPNNIPFKYLPEKQMAKVSDLIRNAYSLVKQSLAEIQEFKANSDYAHTSQSLQDNKVALIVQINKLKDFVREHGTRDAEATEKIKTTVFPRIAELCGQMYDIISKFNTDTNKFLDAVHKVVENQKDLTNEIGLAYFSTD